MADHAFAGYPAPFVYDAPGKKKVQQLIWGDFVRLLAEPEDGWVQVKSRRHVGFMREQDLVPERLLEVAFVDIGQGDGAFLVLPDGQFMLVDAGESDNMLRFLSWRFNLRDNPERSIRFGTSIISHPDQDHYKGFAPLFTSGQFTFDTVYHNGIVERAGSDSLGPTKTIGGIKYLLDPIADPADLKVRLSNPGFIGTKQYPKMLERALGSGSVTQFRGIQAADGFIPGFEDDKALSLQVLGPCTETVEGKTALRWFGDVGKTKNGHSVVLKLKYRDVKVMLGGDLNIPAEEHILKWHTNLAIPASAEGPETDALLAAARTVFQVDIAKACHHGSADFTSLYLRAVNPAATVISSGDDEPHAHPRPDALGAFGKFSRGDRPLIFSTELARSSNENIRDPRALRQEIRDLFDRREALEDPDKRASVDAAIDKTLAKLERSVAVYGLINLRTDGHKAILAQKLERPRAQTSQEWDVHQLEPDSSGTLRYVSKHG